jgi:hypothetical protein
MERGGTVETGGSAGDAKSAARLAKRLFRDAAKAGGRRLWMWIAKPQQTSLNRTRSWNMWRLAICAAQTSTEAILKTCWHPFLSWRRCAGKEIALRSWLVSSAGYSLWDS